MSFILAKIKAALFGTAAEKYYYKVIDSYDFKNPDLIKAFLSAEPIYSSHTGIYSQGNAFRSTLRFSNGFIKDAYVFSLRRLCGHYLYTKIYEVMAEKNLYLAAQGTEKSVTETAAMLKEIFEERLSDKEKAILEILSDSPVVPIKIASLDFYEAAIVRSRINSDLIEQLTKKNFIVR